MDLASAAGAIIVVVFHVPAWLDSDPASWVLSDVCAAVLLLVIEFGRTGACARWMSRLMLLGMGFMALWMLSDGLVWPPLLFVAYTFRGWRLASSNPRGALEETVRVHICAVAAGLPVAILYGWMGWSALVGLVLAVVFFLLSAWMHLYPSFEWLYGEQGPRQPG